MRLIITRIIFQGQIKGKEVVERVEAVLDWKLCERVNECQLGE
jgi:hypothetical protein